MARTKAKARKKVNSPKVQGGSKRRLQEEESSTSKGPPKSTPDRPTKKAKRNKSATTIDSPADNPPSIPVAPSTPGISNNAPVATDTANPPAPSGDLATTHDVTTMSIISSSHIQQKVTRVLSVLATFPLTSPAKPTVIMLHAKAAVASKVISIAEIAKREIAAGGGKWFQYTEVGKVMQEQKEPPPPKSASKAGRERGGDLEEDSVDGDGAGDGDQMSEEETTAFETMKTPFERAVEGRPKFRAVPILTLYLSRVRIDSLRKLHGEQTNALELPKS